LIGLTTKSILPRNIEKILIDPEIEAEIETSFQKSWEEILYAYPDFDERLKKEILEFC